MRRFYIGPDQINQKQPVLTGPDAHHLRSVLRLKAGDPIIVFDGQGAEYQARIASVKPDAVHLTLLSKLTAQTESPVEIVLAQGYLKAKKMDRLVRPLTEIGVNRWVPYRAGRSVATPADSRLQARRQRWEKLSLEAVKQCGRSRPMAIAPASSFEAVLALAQSYELKLIFYEKMSSRSLSPYPEQSPGRIFMLIGPEGGFEPDEVAQAEAAGFNKVGMGPRILRAETAALVACALVQYIYGDYH